jgi:hypothetical protein
MRAHGRGVIGIKIIGDGHFSHLEVDADVIGFKNTNEIDEPIRRIKSALPAPV